MIQTINPYTEKLLKNYPEMEQSEVETHIEAVHKSQQKWANKSIKERLNILCNVIDILNTKKNDLAYSITQEMGKPLLESHAEIQKCIYLCQYYLQHVPKWLKDTTLSIDNKKHCISILPLGIVFCIMPWNYPIWQVMRCVIPALCTGNGVILKHAPNTTGIALEIESIFNEAQSNLIFKTLIITPKQTLNIIAHPHIQAISFTGSTKIGSIIASQAGKYLKKTVLELGGNDAYLVLKDADVNHAAKTLMHGRMLNAGQSCISPKRIWIHQSCYSTFISHAIEILKLYQYGNPNEKKSYLMGPLARQDLNQKLHQQVKNFLSCGAQILYQNDKIPQNGFFFPITILDISPAHSLPDEELFGPVVCIHRFDELSTAIKQINQTRYGLGGGVFSRDIEHAQQIAKYELACGSSAINQTVVSNPYIPFGGIKASGYGRELAREGLMEFTNIKSIAMEN